MLGNVTALAGWIYIGEILEQKHASHMLQACGLGSSQGWHLDELVLRLPNVVFVSILHPRSHRGLEPHPADRSGPVFEAHRLVYHSA